MFVVTAPVHFREKIAYANSQNYRAGQNHAVSANWKIADEK